MATWNDVVNHLKAEHNCNQVSAEILTITFDMGNGRSQLVIVESDGNDKIGEFACVSSPVGSIKNLNKLEAYCREATNWVMGGIVIGGEYILLRDSFPLLNLDVNELQASLLVILAAADQIEAKVTGGDTY
jgi:hypothetical protein